MFKNYFFFFKKKKKKKEEQPLGWWNFSEDGKYTGLEDSLEILLKYMKEEGPFDGIFGFSQGNLSINFKIIFK